MSTQPVELRFWSTEDRYDRVPGPTGMEFDSLVHRTDGTEALEPPETTSFPRLMGASFLLEKFGEIYFANSRRNHNAMARSEHPFCTLKDQTSLPIASAREHGEKETDVPAEGQFKRTAPLNASYNEHDELLLWSNEPRRCRGGETSSQVRFGEVYHDLCNTSDSSGQKRKFSDASSANKEFPNFDKMNRGIKKMRGKEIDDHRDGNRKEEPGGSKMPPWNIDVIEDMTADLDGSLSNLGADLAVGSYNMSEALLSLPSLTVFKQEAPSPSHEALLSNLQSNSDDVHDNNTTLHRLLQQNNSHGALKRNSSGLPSEQVKVHEKKNEDFRFQYVLAAATSIATKVTEETLTYLNQGQSYEIKLKKVGELSNFRGKILKSIIRICFHERRLQYMEKEQIYAWQASRPGERIVELDVPLSYGLFDIEQDPNTLNMLSFMWDPTKEVGAYIKVNCISTEFTPKKHGGEKGVPFRIQVETFIEGETTRLHAAACQIKVFKLKGADRKHKQDREKILKRPLSEQDKYQPSYECTVLNDLLPEAVVPVHSCLMSPNSNPGFRGNPVYTTVDLSESNLVGHSHLRPQVHSPGKTDSGIIIEAGTDKCRSPVPLSPDATISAQVAKLSPEFNCQQTSQWLRKNSFGNYVSTFSNFTGADILRLTRDDLIQICGLPDGIRLLYALHSKAIVRLTLYMCTPSSPVYHAVYLDQIGRTEMNRKLSGLLGIHQTQIQDVFLQGPNEIRVLLTDEVVGNIKDESMFIIEVLKDETRDQFALLLKPTGPTSS